jgi:hypothetical protein
MGNKKYSYTKYEREFMPGMRKKICTCEDAVDLENHFNCTMANLLSRIFENSNLSIERDDILFTPESGKAYRLSSRLLNSGEFMERWDNSDLKSVINRFSHAASHRFIHIKNKNIKAEKKLRK